nr:hypothetical protein RKHAN_02537 [Rhizobium sp. Khangiran2]
MYIEKQATPQVIVDHYKEVNALLTQVGYSTRRRAGLLGKSAQTLKQYSVSPDSAQHRLIPSKDLDMLRHTAVQEFWRGMPSFLDKWAAAEGWYGANTLPFTYNVVDRENVYYDSSHFFAPRVQELADETGGRIKSPFLRVANVSLAPTLPEGAVRRSRWRKAVFALRKKVKPDEVKPILTDITGHCEYNVLRIGIEYLPFRIPAQERWVAALEERIAS